MNRKLSITKDPDDKEIVIYPSEAPTHATLFWLHRAGECSETYDEVFLKGDVPSQHGIKVRILQAPVRVITFMHYKEECAWFNIDAIYDEDILQKPEKEIFDFGHIEQCLTIIHKEVEEEVEEMKKKGIVRPYSRIFIGGAGQGVTMALHYAMTSKEPLGGVISIGGYLLKSTPLHHLSATKFLLLNGSNDVLIPEKISKHSYEKIIDHHNSKYHVLQGEGDEFNEHYVKEVTKFINNNVQHVQHAQNLKSSPRNSPRNSPRTSTRQ